MRIIGLILFATIFLADAAPGGIVRSRVFPASACGKLAPQACGQLVLPSFDGGRVAVTLGRRTESVTGHASFGGRAARSRPEAAPFVRLGGVLVCGVGAAMVFI